MSAVELCKTKSVKAFISCNGQLYIYMIARLCSGAAIFKSYLQHEEVSEFSSGLAR